MEMAQKLEHRRESVLIKGEKKKRAKAIWE